MGRLTLFIALFLGLGPETVGAQSDDYRLHEAALEGDTARVRALLAEGVFVENVDGNGRTALFFAAAANHVPVLEQLLRYGVRLEAADHNRWTALMVAGSEGRLEAVRFLLTWGADPEASADGQTARTLAEERGHQAVARALTDRTSPFRAIVAPTIIPGRVYAESEVDLRPRRVRPGRLRYPEELRRDRIEGGCQVSFVVDADGEVSGESYRTLRCTHLEFRSAARDAIVRARYEPGRIEDTPVPVRVETRYSFTLRD